ncbi:NTF2 domain-containing protein [Mycena kentingensis (nom. inval.)]|nr:NTF2 domain-containing protein [Mycena kentingensis (nom. inval.)]
MLDLPAEILTQIFDIASDEDVIFGHALPTAMAESAWDGDAYGNWKLRAPELAIEQVQRESYATKKAIVRTCTKWRVIGSEFLFRCLFFTDPARLVDLSDILNSSSASATTATASLGWWTRRIHFTRSSASASDQLRDALVRVIQHCPNLEIFILDAPMDGATFGPIVDTLAMYSKKSLHTLYVKIPASALPKVIWAFDSLKQLFAAHVDVRRDSNEQCATTGETPLGAAGDIQLRLPNLRQLSFRGHIQQLTEQAAGWALPALRFLSLDAEESFADLPDVLAFLGAHGSYLQFLDVNSGPAQSLPRILAACPALTTLAFNGDWRVIGAEDDDAAPPLAHERLSSIGLHGLGYAFGVHPEQLRRAEEDGQNDDPVSVWLVTSANDRTLKALCSKEAFPALTRVRALSGALLGWLEEADGPRQDGGGMERWENWWEMTKKAGIRLEDCTGNLLGELPQDGEQDDDEDADTSWDTSYEIDEEYYSQPGSRRVSNLDELKALLEECRAMDLERDDDYLHQDPNMRTIFPEVAGAPSVVVSEAT